MGVLSMQIQQMSLGPLGTNCYIIHDQSEALIIDPGGDPDQVIDYLQQEKLSPQVILLTHAHFDHIGAVDKLRKQFNINVHLHENEADWLEEPRFNGSYRFVGEEIITSRPDHLLAPGVMHTSPFEFEVVHTPGHSPGSVSFIFHKERIVFSGDVLFQQGIGRTDLIGGSMEQLAASIKTHLYTLDDEYTVYPGHGSETSIGEEKRNNPFVSG